MQIDVNFLKFVARETAPFMIFLTCLIAIWFLPEPFDLLLSLILMMYFGFMACKAFYGVMRLRYEIKLTQQERSWNILKDKK
jgi:hypothetical protein